MTYKELDAIKDRLRELRAKRCFPIINRGKLWYERLSSEQIGELKQWYQKWLDCTKTLAIPDDLPWFKDTLEEEEEL